MAEYEKHGYPLPEKSAEKVREWEGQPARQNIYSKLSTLQAIVRRLTHIQIALVVVHHVNSIRNGMSSRTRLEIMIANAFSLQTPTLTLVFEIVDQLVSSQNSGAKPKP